MFDVITIGTASRDVFLQSEFFKILRDPEHLKKIGMPSGEAQCFALGGKIEVGKPVFTSGGGATNAGVTFRRQGLKTAAVLKLGHDQAGQDIIHELKIEGVAPTPMEFIGLQGVFGESGPPAQLVEKYGMGVKDIIRAVKRVIKRK